MWYLRLLLFIPFFRNFMLLDVGLAITSEDNRRERELDKLAKLHATAILHLQEYSWPIGEEVSILIGYQYKRTHWYKPAARIPVYHQTLAVTIAGGIYLTRSGALYVATLVGSPSGRMSAGPCILLDLDRIDQLTEGHFCWPEVTDNLREAFEAIIEQYSAVST